MIRIAIDAFGGDKAPEEIVKGAKLAKDEFPCEIKLVGDRQKILSLTDDMDVYHADETIMMDEKPVQGVLTKENSSIVCGLKLLKDGVVDTFISAGNSGAILSAAVLTVGKLKGVIRPGLAGLIPCFYFSKGNLRVLIDCGANVDCKPQNLFQFGIMGKVFAKEFLKIEKPKIGLISTGAEKDKGSKLVVEAYRLFERHDVDGFEGNIEGDGILSSKVDVLVCDGFIGNVIIKLGESFLKSIGKMDKTKCGFYTYGGAILLGVNGVCVICHGNSNSDAIKSAVKFAIDVSKINPAQKIIDEVNKYEIWS